MYVQWVLLRRGSAYAPDLRDTELTSLLSKRLEREERQSEKGPGDRLACFAAPGLRFCLGQRWEELPESPEGAEFVT